MTRELTYDADNLPDDARSEGAELPDVPSESGHPLDWALQRASAAAAVLADVGLPTKTVSNLLQHTAIRRQNRRWFEFAEELCRIVAQHEDQLNRDFWGTEEWEDLVEEVVTKAADTRQQELLDAYRNLFVNTVLGDDPSFDEAAEISTLLWRCPPSHIQFLRILTEGVGRLGVSTSRRSSESEMFLQREMLPGVAEKIGWPKSLVRRVWRELYSSGVISYDWTNDPTVDGRARRVECRAYTNEFGKRVVAFLSEPGRWRTSASPPRPAPRPRPPQRPAVASP